AEFVAAVVERGHSTRGVHTRLVIALPRQSRHALEPTLAFQPGDESEERRLGDAAAEDEVDRVVANQLLVKLARRDAAEDDRNVGMEPLEQRGHGRSAVRMR